MQGKIFREEAVDNVKSPENLNTYIKVASLGLWMLLASIMILTVGGLIWCIFANLETKVNTVVVVDEKGAVCYLPEDSQTYVNESMVVEIPGFDGYNLENHADNLVMLNRNNSDDNNILHAMNQSSDGWYYTYSLKDADGLDKGLYGGEIILDSVRPISFILNGK